MNLDPMKLSVLDLETGISSLNHGSLMTDPTKEHYDGHIRIGEDRAVYLLTPWHFGHGVIRMWAGLKPGTALDYQIATWRQDSMRTQLQAFIHEAIATHCYVTTWNGVFDVAWLIAAGYRDLEFVSWLDGMQLLKRVKSNDFRLREDFGMRRISFGLKAAAHKMLGVEDYSGGVDFLINTKEMDELMAVYNVQDAIYTHTITLALANSLTPREWKNAQIEADAIYPVARAWVDGIAIDRRALDDLHRKLQFEIGVAENALKNLDPSKDWKKVVSSPAQLSTVLFNEWRHTPTKVTDAGANSTDKETLILLSEIDPKVRLLFDLRTAMRNYNKFVETTQNALDFNKMGRVHPQCQIYGTYTGRMVVSSSVNKRKHEQTGIALHQWKRDADYRALIRPTGGGRTIRLGQEMLIEIDAAGQEFRWMAIASGDETMLQLCQPGEDAHAYMGAQIYGADYAAIREASKRGDAEASKIRRLGKVGNLSLQYRTSASKLRTVARIQHGVTLSEAEAQHIHATYLQTYPRVRDYWNRQTNTARMEGVVWTFGGRKLELRGDWGNSEQAWAMSSSAINFPIQGTGADQKYLVLSEVSLRIPKMRFMFDLHDGLFFACPYISFWDSSYSHLCALQRVINEQMPYEEQWGFAPPIPLPWDMKVGFNWGDMETIDLSSQEAFAQQLERLYFRDAERRAPKQTVKP